MSLFFSRSTGLWPFQLHQKQKVTFRKIYILFLKCQFLTLDIYFNPKWVNNYKLTFPQVKSYGKYQQEASEALRTAKVTLNSGFAISETSDLERFPTNTLSLFVDFLFNRKKYTSHRYSTFFGGYFLFRLLHLITYKNCDCNSNR